MEVAGRIWDMASPQNATFVFYSNCSRQVTYLAFINYTETEVFITKKGDWENTCK